MKFTFFSFGLFALLLLSGCNHSTKKAALNKSVTDSLAKIVDPNARIVVLDKYIAEQPTNAVLFMEKSKAYDQLGNLDKALENAKLAIEKDTPNTAYYFYMADLFMKKPSLSNALNTMERLKFSQPKNKMVYVKIAELQVNGGKNDESLKTLEQALKIDPNIPEAYFWIGYNFREMKKPDRAIPAFQKAIELRPDYEDAYTILGLLYQDKKDPKAAEYFTSAIRIAPKDTVVLYDRGKYYQDIDSFNRAIDDYKKILEVDPNQRSANYGIGYCLYQQKKYEDALGYFSKVILNNPKDAAAHYSKSQCYKALGNSAKAKEELEISDRLEGR